VVEVDKERGRIGLRLADDPEVEGKTAEELVSVGTGDKGGDRGDRPRRGGGGDRGGRGGRGGRDRDGGNGDYRRDRR
jgi:polyribonucleotide nucleotidyltransferase